MHDPQLRLRYLGDGAQPSDGGSSSPPSYFSPSLESALYHPSRAVRVDVVLLGAHVVPPLSDWVRWAIQSGSGWGADARVVAARVRMMRQLVRGAVTTRACRPALSP
ncbi:hypothetical protein ACFWWM_27025 [Streptomyces sp. NPDC058682]|uniref:hypothetical protein n=1 Tax=Streptomyces sp. NPDC058682 TaxID=3346596 RepID=UPI003657BA2C